MGKNGAGTVGFLEVLAHPPKIASCLPPMDKVWSLVTNQRNQSPYSVLMAFLLESVHSHDKTGMECCHKTPASIPPKCKHVHIQETQGSEAHL